MPPKNTPKIPAVPAGDVGANLRVEMADQALGGSASGAIDQVQGEAAAEVIDQVQGEAAAEVIDQVQGEAEAEVIDQVQGEAAAEVIDQVQGEAEAMEEISDSATVESSPVFTHNIRSIPERGFCRSGRYWPFAGLDVARVEFSDEQWEALNAEPRLSVKTL